MYRTKPLNSLTVFLKSQQLDWSIVLICTQITGIFKCIGYRYVCVLIAEKSYLALTRNKVNAMLQPSRPRS